MISEVRLLDQAQTEAFDTEHVDDDLFSIVSKIWLSIFIEKKKYP
jgi:hypothetical protein